MEGKELIRLTTAGSVDDGKSTLIGRLLFDCNQIYQDHIDAVKRSGKTVDGEIDYSLFTDGLSSEREQGITIDVAYRYFSASNRRFIVADVPGHEQYTKNMVTGASQADVAIILIDVREGMTQQSKRHLFIASLLGIKHVLIVVNKMDLVDYDQSQYDQIITTVQSYTAKLTIPDLEFIPLSALKGDMVVHRGDHMPWYEGKTLLHYLETVQIASDRNLIDFRLPIQYIIRPNQDERYYAGTIESGSLHVGDMVMILPSKKTTTITDIYVADENTPLAFAPQAVAIKIADDIDISRGDMIVRPNNQATITRSIDTTLCWLADSPLDLSKRYIIKHTTQQTYCHIQSLVYGIDIDTSGRQNVDTLTTNAIGRVFIDCSTPLLLDTYQENKGTGAAILIDEQTHQTVAAIIIRSERKNSPTTTPIKKSPIIWFTGLSGSGKSTLADALAKKLAERDISYQRLDGDVMRAAFDNDLGFSKEDRFKNIARAQYLATMFQAHGIWVLASFIAPNKSQREAFRQSQSDVVEVFVDTPLSCCKERDPKGLYQDVAKGTRSSFTGIDSTYEPPTNPDIHIHTEGKSVATCVEEVLNTLSQKHYL